MMATETAQYMENPKNQKVTSQAEEHSEPTNAQETITTANEQEPVPEFSDKEFPAPPSPSSESSKDTEHEGRFLDRLNAFPMVAEGVNYVKSIVDDDTKVYHRYAKYALTTAETALTKVSEIAETRFPNQVSAADHLAVKSLDYLEEQLPVLKQNSSQVYESSRQVISGIVATPYAAVNTTLVSVANNAEAVLDRILPATSDEDNENIDEDGIARLRHVTVDAQRRVIKVVRGQIDNLTSEKDSLLNLKDTNVYLQRVSTELTSLNDKLRNAISSTKDNVVTLKDSSIQYLQKTQIQLIDRIKAETDNVANLFKLDSSKLPESLRTQLEPALKFFNERYALLTEEFQKKDQTTLQLARNAIILATESVPYLEDTRNYIASFINKTEAEKTTQTKN